MNSDLKYWLAFSQIKKIGPKRFNLLLNYFPDLSYAWKASASELIQAGLPENLSLEISVRRPEINPDKQIEELVKNRVQVVTIKDENYPKLLKEIYNPPPLLYFKGKLKTDELPLAVVGTRKISNYGRQVCEQLVGDLTLSGFSIISGLALGIDACAHLTAVKKEGRTIAVLGSGLDKAHIYPSHNRYLAEQIVNSGGCLFSEYPLGTIALKQHFPHRNRIIAGLALGTLIIEAAASSGSLITAKYALEFNREVMAVPGNIYAPSSAGCNELIKQGAKPILSIEDILEEFSLEKSIQVKQTQENLRLTEEEEDLLEIITNEPQHFNELVKKSNKPAAEIASTLSLLEIKGLVKNTGGSIYIKK